MPVAVALDLVALRQAIYDQISDTLAGFPVALWLPEDVEELPCAVVGRPAVVPHPELTTGLLLSTVVTVVGRRLTADDAQQELDVAAWQVFGALCYFRGWLEGTTRFMCSELIPEQVTIAADEYPVYRITVDASLIDC